MKLYGTDKPLTCPGGCCSLLCMGTTTRQGKRHKSMALDVSNRTYRKRARQKAQKEIENGLLEGDAELFLDANLLGMNWARQPLKKYKRKAKEQRYRLMYYYQMSGPNGEPGGKWVQHKRALHIIDAKNMMNYYQKQYRNLIFKIKKDLG